MKQAGRDDSGGSLRLWAGLPAPLRRGDDAFYIEIGASTRAIVIEPRTLSHVKSTLQAEHPPTDADLDKLPVANDDNDPGVYHARLKTKQTLKKMLKPHYVGSATSPGKGLAHRIGKHHSKFYRRYVRSRGEGSYLYTFRNKKGCGYYFDFRKLCVDKFATGKPRA